MVKIMVSDESYVQLVRMVAQTLESEMLHGKVEKWDDENCKTLRTLLELNMNIA